MPTTRRSICCIRLPNPHLLPPTLPRPVPLPKRLRQQPQQQQLKQQRQEQQLKQQQQQQLKQQQQELRRHQLRPNWKRLTLPAKQLLPPLLLPLQALALLQAPPLPPPLLQALPPPPPPLQRPLLPRRNWKKLMHPRWLPRQPLLQLPVVLPLQLRQARLHPLHRVLPPPFHQGLPTSLHQALP